MSDGIIHDGFPIDPNYEPELDSEISGFIEYGDIICNEAARGIAGWYAADSASPRADAAGTYSSPNSFVVFATSGKVRADLIPDIQELQRSAAILDPEDPYYPDIPDQREALAALLAHIQSYWKECEV